MKLVLFGGTGHIGRALIRNLDPSSYDIRVITRNPIESNHVGWDGRTLDAWADTLEGSDVVINLAGRRVHCRYNETNLQEMMDSRIRSTEVIGEAIEACKAPPKLWLQSSTATIYQHTFGEANDELTGVLGGSEPGAPAVWNFSIKIAKKWEAAFLASDTPRTRKIALRSAIMMGIDRESAFDVFSRLARLGLGGRLASGKQFVSWIHEVDFCRALEFLITHENLQGAINIASPNPLPQIDFARGLREAWGVPFGLPATPWMIAMGARFLNGDSELVLKSRRVIPTILADAGFQFEFPCWSPAAKDLADRMRKAN
jgi:uncharacterized protein (TIGR01777 family)